MNRNRISSPFLMALQMAAMLLLPVYIAVGQESTDTVVIQDKRSGDTVELKGMILSWKGQTIEFRSRESVRKIDSDNVIETRTNWHEAWNGAKRLMARNRFRDAMNLIPEAISGDSREWTNAIMRSQLVELQLLDDQTVVAGREFIRLLRDDPQSRLLYAIPLAWDTSPVRPEMEQVYVEWMESSIPAVQLMGASWLLDSTRRQEAETILENLAGNIDNRIAQLATAQLWRKDWVSADETTLQQWRLIVDQMPESFRAGPSIVLSRVESRLGNVDESLYRSLAPAILYPERLSIGRLGLHIAAGTLEKAGRNDEAVLVRREIGEKFTEMPLKR